MDSRRMRHGALPAGVRAWCAAARARWRLVVRSVRTAVELLDPGLEDAAAVLGAGPLRRFRTVTLPLASPGVVAGLSLGFARSLGEFGATITLAGSIAGETRTLPLAIFQGTQVPGGDGAALRLTVVSVLLSAAALLASELVVRRLQGQAGGFGFGHFDDAHVGRDVAIGFGILYDTQHT